MGGISTNDDRAYDVELRAVTKRFGSLTAVDAVNLRVRKGEFLSLLGPSGCGKTTSLRLIAGFEQPDEGEILIGGVDAAGAPLPMGSSSARSAGPSATSRRGRHLSSCSLPAGRSTGRRCSPAASSSASRSPGRW